MGKQTWKAGNMLYPLPAVMVSVTDGKGQDDIITVAWTGTICTNPPMVYISVRPSRFSHHMLMETGEFVINLTTEKLTRDYGLLLVSALAETLINSKKQDLQEKRQNLSKHL